MMLVNLLILKKKYVIVYKNQGKDIVNKNYLIRLEYYFKQIYIVIFFNIIEILCIVYDICGVNKNYNGFLY